MLNSAQLSEVARRIRYLFDRNMEQNPDLLPSEHGARLVDGWFPYDLQGIVDDVANDRPFATEVRLTRLAEERRRAAAAPAPVAPLTIDFGNDEEDDVVNEDHIDWVDHLADSLYFCSDWDLAGEVGVSDTLTLTATWERGDYPQVSVTRENSVNDGPSSTVFNLSRNGRPADRRVIEDPLDYVVTSATPRVDEYTVTVTLTYSQE